MNIGKLKCGLFSGRFVVWVTIISQCTLCADWTLIDDFESYEPGIYREYPRNGEFPLFYPGHYYGVEGRAEIIQGVEGISGEQACWWGWANGFMYGTAEFWHLIPLPTEIAVGEKATLFWRLWMEDLDDLGWYVGLSHFAPGEWTQENSFWSETNAVMRYLPVGGFETLSAYNGTGYWAVDRPGAVAAGEWYAIWMVVDYRYRGSVPVGGYSLYYQSSTDPDPVRLSWSHEAREPDAFLSFRNTRELPLQTLFFHQVAGLFSGQNLWLVDDIYQAEGACLSDPTTGEPCRTWYRYPLIGDNADTLGWLDWLYVAEDPWVWSYSLESWLYVPGVPEARGGWVYVAR